MKKVQYISLAILLLSFTACSSSVEESNQAQFPESQEILDIEGSNEEESDREETEDIEGTEDVKAAEVVEGTKDTGTMDELPVIRPGETAAEKSKYTDQNGDIAIIPMLHSELRCI